MVTTKKCAFGECKNDSRYPELWERNSKKEKIFFCHFPGPKRQKDRRERWIKACHRGDNFVCTKDSYICSLHFIGGNGPTKENPDPISAICSQEKVEVLRSLKRRSSLAEKRDNAKKIKEERVAVKGLLELSTAPASQGKTFDELTVAETLVSLVDLHEKSDSADDGTNMESMADTQREGEIAFIVEENVQNESGTQTLAETSTQTGPDTLKYLFLEKVEDAIKTYHYTGMDKECLNFIFEEIKEKASRIHTWKGRKRTVRHQSHKKYLKQKDAFSKLTTREQFLFTLIRLRRNPSMTMLCDIFGISAGIGSRIFITWVLFLEKELHFLLHFSTINDLQGVSQPKALQKIKNLRAIIDCTEFFIEQPSLPSSQRSTYSQYKSSNTFKLLISISPVPHINYVSQLYSGSISDKDIVGRSGFLDKLNPGDVIMADKGFNIQDLLAKHECKLNAPPILRKNKVSAEASTATRRVATSRVHIERMIKRVKAFGILQGVLSLALKPYFSSVVKVCAILVNLQANIIAIDDKQ